MAKMCRKHLMAKPCFDFAPLQMLFTDQTGKISTCSLDGSNYFEVIVDYATGYTWVNTVACTAGITQRIIDHIDFEEQLFPTRRTLFVQADNLGLNTQQFEAYCINQHPPTWRAAPASAAATAPTSSSLGRSKSTRPSTSTRSCASARPSRRADTLACLAARVQSRASPASDFVSSPPHAPPSHPPFPRVFHAGCVGADGVYVDLVLCLHERCQKLEALVDGTSLNGCDCGRSRCGGG
ncbi:hypothetical protein DFJ73DRAFT_346734 [Zopfochytrium polystomum]|nr:hypothetical protein DFJ73DRAFT_346734 [Zopfochytrium polystomum]